MLAGSVCAAVRTIACVAGAILGVVLPAVARPEPWLDLDGRPSAAALQAVAMLTAAADDGLDPLDYDAPALRAALEAARADAGAADTYGFEHRLTDAILRFATDLGTGRVDPDDLRAHYSVVAAPRTDLRHALIEAARTNRLPEVVKSMAPAIQLYGLLRAELARYRSGAIDEAWSVRWTPYPRRALRLGDVWSGIPVLERRLTSLGDLSASEQDVSSRGAALNGASVYDTRLRAAVMAFQARHGLTPDGVLGRDTLAQLEVAPSRRVRAIELTMERLRWTPLARARREIVVNIPEFTLRAYEVIDGRVRVGLTMKVIVGRAMRTGTPLIDDDMRFIEFSPYWNVPPSIARKETVPRLRRDPGYWEREGMEFVAPSGEVLSALSAARLDAVLTGSLRIRQRPGPRNALGDIKFVFPNHENIYLHHTPAVELFGRERRDFSHGCIRVEAPVELARFVLAGMPEWTEQRIRDAMAAGHSSTLRLSQPIPVVIAYATVLVTGGRIHFLPDLYGLDRELDDALRRRTAVRRMQSDSTGIAVNADAREYTP